MLRLREEDRAGITDHIQVTEWNEFRALDLDQLKARMCGDVLIDLHNIYLPVQAKEVASPIRGSDALTEGSRLMATEDDCTGPADLGNSGEFTVRQLAGMVVGWPFE